MKVLFLYLVILTLIIVIFPKKFFNLIGWLIAELVGQYFYNSIFYFYNPTFRIKPISNANSINISNNLRDIINKVVDNAMVNILKLVIVLIVGFILVKVYMIAAEYVGAQIRKLFYSKK